MIRDVIVGFVKRIFYKLLYSQNVIAEIATTRIDETRALPLSYGPKMNCWSHRDSNPGPRS
jgi:hypothetical protein